MKFDDIYTNRIVRYLFLIIVTLMVSYLIRDYIRDNNKSKSLKSFVTFKNFADESMWPGIYPSVQSDVWEIKPGEERSFEIPDGWTGEVWPRYKCGPGGCKAGDCVMFDGSMECKGRNKSSGHVMNIGIEDGDYVVHSDHSSGSSHKNFVLEETDRNSIDISLCPPENRVFSDKLCDESTCLINKKYVNSSKCFLNSPEEREECESKYMGCRSPCDSITKGWLGHYINKGYTPENDKNYDDWVKLFTRDSQIPNKCDDDKINHRITGNNLCRESKSSGRDGDFVGSKGNMSELFCCTGNHGVSPYTDCSGKYGEELLNCVASMERVCPTSNMNNIPETSLLIRSSSNKPNWPLSSLGTEYSSLFPENSSHWRFGEPEKTKTEKLVFYVTD